MRGRAGMADDTRWIEKAKRGSRAAAEELIRRYYDEIYRYAFRQTGQKETAMDITQEIFIAVLQSIPYYDEKKAGVRTWIYRIATHKIIDSRRRAPIPALDIGEMVLADEMDVAKLAQDRFLLEKILRYIESQPVVLQKIARMRLYGGCSFPEIAQALGEPEAAVKSRYYRLRAALRKEFRDEYTHAGGK